jgi:hypothetical protein
LSSVIDNNVSAVENTIDIAVSISESDSTSDIAVVSSSASADATGVSVSADISGAADAEIGKKDKHIIIANNNGNILHFMMCIYYTPSFLL